MVSGFVIQGGGYTPELTLKTPERPPFRTSPAMASAIAAAPSPWPGPANRTLPTRSSTSISQITSRWIPKPTRWGYAVFGEVVQGIEVVDEIGHRATSGRDGMQDVPVEPVVIRKISVLKTPVAR